MTEDAKPSSDRTRWWQRIRSEYARKAKRERKRFEPALEGPAAVIRGPGNRKPSKGGRRGWRIASTVFIHVVLLAVGYWAVAQSITLGNPAKDLPAGDRPGLGDLAALLFGASSLAVILFSLLLAVAALLGYETLKNNVKREIEEETMERVTGLEGELQGRVLVAIGFMIGSLHSSPDRLEQDEKHKEYLSEAVYFLREGYRKLKGLPGTGEYMALNNLVYYSCLNGEDFRRNFLLEQGRELRKIGQDYIHPDSLLTYCRVVLQYGSDSQEIRDAKLIADSLLRTENLTPLQRREATFYVKELGLRGNDRSQ